MSIQIETSIAELEDILPAYQTLMDQQYLGYRNHVYRMIHCCFALKSCTQEERKKIIIAAAFHDIGIWIEDTVDYIPPSIVPMLAYLKKHQLEAWTEEITLMISEHHKMTPYTDTRYPLVEIFRKGDLIDFSFGKVHFNMDKSDIKALQKQFPEADFHKDLAKRASKWFLKHPFNPAPMMKW